MNLTDELEKLNAVARGIQTDTLNYERILPTIEAYIKAGDYYNAIRISGFKGAIMQAENARKQGNTKELKKIATGVKSRVEKNIRLGSIMFQKTKKKIMNILNEDLQQLQRERLTRQKGI